MPVMTYEKRLSFHLNGETVEVFHFGPGHTDGDSVIYFPTTNVIHMGDLYFEGFYPYIGIYSGGSISNMIGVINQILPMIDDGTQVVPGHGPVTDKARLQEYVSMLTAIRDNVHRLMQEGKTLKEVVAAKPTRAFDDNWGVGLFTPDQFASLVYMSLSPEMP
jgi:glyoxylase-like metal-dependent hydrolase (beta-lactamase superfamily II)